MTPDASIEQADVVIIGAGLSGIGAACRLRAAHPHRTLAILEARAVMGGTWDLFRYPGVRSDSDMHTLGYSFKPWTGGRTVAPGADVLAYLHELADEHHLSDLIQVSSRVVAADFDTGTARWTLTIEDPRDGSRRSMTCGFLYCCTGYYDYDRPHEPDLPGIGDFAGEVVHPQFWPEELEYAGRRVVVIGSGATAVTLVPALLDGEHAAAHVTMLQRTPSWIVSLPGEDTLAKALETVLPDSVVHRVVRARNIVLGMAFVELCRRLPTLAGRLLIRRVAKAVGSEELAAEHFTPPYRPWDQRLCAVPDGDFFTAIRSGAAEVVTDEIERLVPEGVRLRSGKLLEADVVVTATGLRLLALGGLRPSVDGVAVDLAGQYVWHGTMLTGLPNLALSFGYARASWTLRADISHRLVSRLLGWMDREGYAAVVPRADGPMTPRPLIGLRSGYVRRQISEFPHQSDRNPWRVWQNYVVDLINTRRAVPVRDGSLTSNV